MTKPYSKEIEAQMQKLHRCLSEKNRRLYAGVEALKLAYGGISYIARLFGCSRDTVLRGIKELTEEEILPENRTRKVGGGRQAVLDKTPEINKVFLLVLDEHAVENKDTINDKIKYTDLSCAEIAALLAKKGFKVSVHIVKQLLEKHGYVKHKGLKQNPQQDK